MRVDYLIIGQGLAGSLLAWALIQRQCNVIILDSGQENASQVAAGLINPITGQRFVKSADVEVLLSAATACYAALSDFFQQVFYLQKPMLRIFNSEAESKNAQRRLHNPDYQVYLSDEHWLTNGLDAFAAPFGVLHQKQTGHLLTSRLLACLKDFFIAQGCYRQVDVNYADIQPYPVLSWQDILPQRIIFCEGYHIINNPWFSWLPLQPAKGEILTLHSDTELPDTIFNYGHWLLPLEKQQFRIGATFDRENINTLPTEQGRASLVTKLKSFSRIWAAAPVLHHQANVRPCTADRQPFIGHHPENPHISLFNGFGAKGSLQIPWFSQHFADALLRETPLIDTCNIQRYYARYSSSF